MSDSRNCIPPMTHVLSRHWEQPLTEDILLDEKHAMLSEADFRLLKDYSMSQPTGAYEGKMWKAQGFFRDDKGLHWTGVCPSL
ncbi:MAG: hypothetical protein WA584_23590 [Pyrinomonadaceae bacterium]